MKVTLILADFAQVAEGKLSVIGGGWSMTRAEGVQQAIALIIEVPWDRTNEKHQFRLELVDADGNAVMTVTPEGQQPLFIQGEFEVGRPPGIKRGTPINFPAAINIGPQGLEKATRYEWRLTVNGEGNDDWRLAFSTQP